VRRKLPPLIVAVAALLVAAGCGTGGLPTAGGDKAQGAQLFTQKCAGCHALADAGSTANVGPNLDAAFGYDKAQGFKESAVASVVLDQMRFPSGVMPGPSKLFPVCEQGKPNRPAGCVEGQEAAMDDVAAYVASVAGSQGGEPPKQTTTDGKALFASNCASCHTLKAANATGAVGPNLDQLKPPLAIVKNQVIHGGGAMPAFKGKLSAAQIDAVSKFVADNAGK
jgi:mono/diheme cytochrome c family protein